MGKDKRLKTSFCGKESSANKQYAVKALNNKVKTVNKKASDVKNPPVSGSKVAAAAEIESMFETKKKSIINIAEQASDSDGESEGKQSTFYYPEQESYGLLKSNNPVIISNPEAPLERIDKDSGLPVYKAHLLKVGEGGGTPLCPFDCNCCF